jgi:hypothetical protein
MVHLTEAENEFAARVLVAKLGSAGILAEVRGVCSAYPSLGSAQVFVEESEYPDARELIVADLDDRFAVDVLDEIVPGPLGRGPNHPLLRPALLATSLLLVGTFTLAHCDPAPTVHAR